MKQQQEFQSHPTRPCHDATRAPDMGVMKRRSPDPDGEALFGWPGCQARDAVECARIPVTALPQRPANHTRFVCVSDTHDLHWSVPVPPGDVFIHAGDILVGSKNLSREAAIKKYKDFNDWLGALPHPHKYIVGGNHDCYLDPEQPDGMQTSDVRALLSHATFLHNECATIPVPCNGATAELTKDTGGPRSNGGLRIFGTSLSYGVSGNAAFQARHDAGRGDAIVALARKTEVGATSDRDDLASLPLSIPPIDVFVSHHAIHPRARGDPITEAVLGANPIARVHVGGHFHEWYGATRHPIRRGPSHAAGGSVSEQASAVAEVVTACACSVDGKFNLNRGAVVFDMAAAVF
jgi:hypothetical protein